MEAAGAGLVQEPQTLLHVVVDGAQGGHDGRGPEPVGDGGEVRQMSLHEVRINIIIIIFSIFVIIIIIKLSYQSLYHFHQTPYSYTLTAVLTSVLVLDPGNRNSN